MHGQREARSKIVSLKNQNKAFSLMLHCSIWFLVTAQWLPMISDGFSSARSFLAMDRTGLQRWSIMFLNSAWSWTGFNGSRKLSPALGWLFSCSITFSYSFQFIMAWSNLGLARIQILSWLTKTRTWKQETYLFNYNLHDPWNADHQFHNG